MAKKVGNTYFFTGKGKSSGGGGGGGDATDAIKYTEQTLNESQKMQARKNQGLYYSEGGGEDVTLTWDGDTTGLERVEVNQGGIMYKVSDNSPQKELVKSLGMTVNGVEQIIDISPQAITPIEGGYAMGESFVIVITESEGTVSGLTFTKGIWFVKGVSTGNYVSKFTYGVTETIHHIEPKYIKDMYYEETNEGEIDVNIPNPDEWPYPDSIYLSGMDYFRVSGETPQQSDITAIFRIEGQDVTVDGVDLEIKTTGYGSKLIAYQAPDSNLTETQFLIVPEDTTIEGVSTPKGIYFPQISSYANNHIESISFPGTITTVHQIPAKYVPQTVPAVKIEIPGLERVSYGIGYVLLSQYVSGRDVAFSIEGKTINQVAVRNMLDTTSTGDVWDFGTGNTYYFHTSGYYLVEIEVQETPSSSAYYYATVFVETVNS